MWREVEPGSSEARTASWYTERSELSRTQGLRLTLPTSLSDRAEYSSDTRRVTKPIRLAHDAAIQIAAPCVFDAIIAPFMGTNVARDASGAAQHGKLTPKRRVL